MSMKRFAVLTLGALVAAVVLPTAPAQAQGNFPNRPVRMIVPFPPGQATDIVARLLGDALTRAWNQQVIIDNRGGGGGVPGTEAVVKAAPDGYTLLAGSVSTHSFAPVVTPKLGYDPIKDFAALAKSKPGIINYGSPGVGTVGHLATELFASQLGIKLNHVPYKGAALYTIDLIAGHIEFAIIQFAGCAPLLNQGKLRAIGATSGKRTQLLPNLPTVAEQGVPGFVSYNWNGVLAPAATPKAVIARIHDILSKQLATPQAQELYLSQGHEPGGGDPEEYAAFLRAEIQKWAKVAKAANIRE